MLYKILCDICNFFSNLALLVWKYFQINTGHSSQYWLSVHCMLGSVLSTFQSAIPFSSLNHCMK